MQRDSTSESERERLAAFIDHSDGNKGGAQHHLEKALSFDPTNFKAHRLQIAINLEHGLLDDARAGLNALNKDLLRNDVPNFVLLHLAMSDVHNARSLYDELHGEISNGFDAKYLEVELQIAELRPVGPSSSFETFDYNAITRIELALDKVGEAFNPRDELATYRYNWSRGRIALFKNDFREASAHFESCYGLNPLDPALIHAYLKALHETSAYEKALRVSLSLNLNDYASRMWRYTILLYAEHYEEVITEIDEAMMSTYFTRQQEVELLEIKIVALTDLVRSGEALNVGNHLLNKYSDIPYTKKIYAELIWVTGRHNEAIALLEQSMPARDSDAYGIMAHALLSLLFKSNDPKHLDKALGLGSSVCQPVSPDSVFILYLRLLFNKERYHECIELCKQVEQYHGFIPEVKRIEASAYFNSEDFAKSREIWIKLYTKRRSDPTILFRVCTSSLKLGLIKEAMDALDMSSDQLTQDAAFQDVASRVYQDAYTLSKDPEHGTESMNFAFKAVSSSPTTQSYANRLIGLMTFFGAEVQTAISDEQANQYRALLATYRERFPDSDAFTFLDVGNDVDGFVTHLIEELRKKNESGSALLDLYTEHKYPPAFLSMQFGRDIAETWTYCCNTPSGKFWFGSTQGNLFAAEDSIADGATHIVVSISSLLTISMLDLFDQFQIGFASIHVTQAGFDALQVALASNSRHATSGGQHLVGSAGGVTILDTDPSYYAEWERRLTLLRDFIVTNRAIVGDAELHIVRDEHYDGVCDFMGSEAASFIYMNNPNYVKYADEHFLRLNHAKPGLKGMHTVAWLRMLRRNGKIKNDNYAGSLAALIKYNYKIVPIDSDTLNNAIESSAFTLSPTLITLLSILTSDEYTPETVFSLLTVVLQYIWLNATTPESRAILTEFILDVMSHKKSRAIVAGYLLRNIDSVVSPINALRRREFIDIIRQWPSNT